MSEHSWLLICSGTHVYGGGGQHRPVYRTLARGVRLRRDHSSEVVRGGLGGRVNMWHSCKIVFVCCCCTAFALNCPPAVWLKFHCLFMVVFSEVCCVGNCYSSIVCFACARSPFASAHVLVTLWFDKLSLLHVIYACCERLCCAYVSVLYVFACVSLFSCSWSLHCFHSM